MTSDGTRSPGYRVNRWTGAPPSEQAVREIYAREGLQPYTWSNGPHDVYGVHAHPYEKVLRVVRGSIRFDLAAHHTSVDLQPGDELVLPAGVAHSAVVGPQGVTCLEAHRPSPC
jgi:mannose-6-phosphate isomerase-like protein (cupin superfamily)